MKRAHSSRGKGSFTCKALEPGPTHGYWQCGPWSHALILTCLTFSPSPPHPGVVFPTARAPPTHSLTFEEAKEACLRTGAVIASPGRSRPPMKQATAVWRPVGCRTDSPGDRDGSWAHCSPNPAMRGRGLGSLSPAAPPPSGHPPHCAPVN